MNPVWNGKELITYGDIIEAMDSCKTKEQAQEFMAMMRKCGDHADENIGYMTGYFSSDRAKQMREWFGVKHPIFGDTDPTPEEAFKKGAEMGRKAKSQ